ncbi:MAG: glycoside hydrolase family 2 protein [Pirellulales bacterium]
MKLLRAGIAQRSSAVVRLVVAAVAIAACVPPTAAAEPAPGTPGRLMLRSGWRVKSSVLVDEPAETVSSGQFKPAGWFAASVPSTVLSVLVKNGVYPDPRVGMNAYQIPDSSDEFNRRHDLARFSYLPDRRNPWRDPYWYRTEFDLSAASPGRRVWLHFDAINCRAEPWLNGRRIADRETMAGMFQRFEFDVTEYVRPGRNVLAVKVYPVDHPGTPNTQWEVLGPDRGYQSELMQDVTEIMTIGYDCMMTVPDRNMGLWQDVWIERSGPVVVRHPFVVTRLPLPKTDRATLSISAEVTNASAVPVQGTLRGEIAGTGVRFEQAVRLGPHETRRIDVNPKPVIENPRLWWPVNCGEQYLYDLALRFETGGGVSDEGHVAFGVREIGSEMHEIDGWHGRRVLVNGRKVFCRGGYIQPELMFDWDARRMEAEIRYYARANLNLIYFEDIPNPPAPFLELCDRYGILFGNCFYSCYWLRPGTPYPADFPLLERSTVDLVKRYRNHPSLVMYMAMNEEDTKEEVYRMWRRHILELDGTRWFIPSAYFPTDRKNVPAWFANDLPTGMTDKGASYSWAEPAAYFRWVREKRNWMFMMESGSASLPPMSSLSRFIPDLNTTAAGPLFPLTKTWAHHGANHYYQGYDSALRRLHGEPESVADYCWKGHLVTADQHRSMFEAANHRMWDVTSGFTQWKINACEPSIQWQIFDWYHKPMVSWFYIKKACEPLHVQLNLPDRTVSVINTTEEPRADLTLAASVYDLDAKRRWHKTAKADAPANAYKEAFEVAIPPDLGPVAFVKLQLADARGTILSDNFYWLPAADADGLKALGQLPLVRLTKSFAVQRLGRETVLRAEVSNPTDKLAFFVQLAATKGPKGGEILPVVWDDNYFSLLPGESRVITARVATVDCEGAAPVLEVGGWNVQTAFDCTRLAVSSTKARQGETITAAATIADTFLDGSRVAILVDGQPEGFKWAWARDGRRDRVEFTLQLDRPGEHAIQVGKQTVRVDVR